MNVHTPQRGSNESQREYRARREKHHRIAASVLRGVPSVMGTRFVLHQAAPEKQMRRELVQRVGRRQAIKTIKHDRRAYCESQVD